MKMKLSKNNALIGVAIVGIIVAGILVFSDSGTGFSIDSLFGSSDKEIAEKAIKYINDNGFSQEPASLVSVEKESGLVKIKIKIGETEFDSYVSKDGKLLFPQAFVMDKEGEESSTASAPDKSAEEAAAEIVASLTKTDSPVLEAYIVSQCPFGLQMQRMMAEAIKSQPSLAQNLKARYIGAISGNTITAMHGDAEAKENFRQICIREEQPTKYWDYVSCYMQKGDATGCDASVGINTSSVNSCIATASRGLAYAKQDFDLSDQYGASGSPTLVLGGVTVSEFTAGGQPIFGGRSADEMRTIVCSAFSTQPAFCSAKLNTAQAATGYSETYQSSGASGSSGADANCDPA